jgi:ribosomal protein S18 acetylase RimI-like enzyme
MVVTNPYVFTPAAHTQLIPYLAALQASCISQDGYIATFLPPLSHEKLLAWWRDRIAEVNNGTRVILLLLDESAPGTRARGGELVGVVMLAMPETETGPFRAYIEDLLVATRFRRRGAAKMLLSAVEMEAVQKGKTLLVSLSGHYHRLVTPIKSHF